MRAFYELKDKNQALLNKNPAQNLIWSGACRIVSIKRAYFLTVTALRLRAQEASSEPVATGLSLP
jgi:hypothetical protein